MKEWEIEKIEYVKTLYSCEEKKLESIDQLSFCQTNYSVKLAGSYFPIRMSLILPEERISEIDGEIDLIIGGLPETEHFVDAQHMLKIIADGKGVLKTRKYEGI